MPGKLVTIAGLVLIMCGNSFATTPAPAVAPQIETRQDPAQKEMQDRMAREANKKRQQDIRERDRQTLSARHGTESRCGQEQ